jgi:predicted ArsR family transcriptional regulator
LYLLKMRGPQSAASLGTALGITGEAARQQLVKLAAAGLVEADSTPHGVGRPTQLWALTENAAARFPDTHAELTVQLLRSIRSELGEAALDRLIDARAAESLTNYTAALAGATDLEERVRRLAEFRAREGYMAECQPAEGGFLLIENHCPICAAATECQGFCRSERDVFEQSLGSNISVERMEHIVGGDRRCTYRIALKCVFPSTKNEGKKEG